MAVTPVSPSAGQLIDKTFWDAQVFQQFTDLYASWTPFTSVWSGATTNPVLGNGTLDSAYMKIGKTAFVRLRLVFGTTTTVGNGLWGFTFPAAITPAYVQSLAGFCSNQLGTIRYVLGAYLTAGSGIFRVANSANSSGVSHNSPLAWANGDQLVLSGSFECS
ncbi:hypothetical protein ABT061_15845 [Streptosporangium sp. NPDC002544]|uniref:hypothetical protein n=1 Tax=Streptosporangium sp. NPDC002544 TaxID=3154538 RepID=UPI00332066A1